MPRPTPALTGMQFGRLTALEPIHTGRRFAFRCRCKCGAIIDVLGYNLQNGNTKSCGCYKNELVGKRRRTHGQSYSREHAAWCGMKNRCYNATDKRYADYGGRGIQVCERWRNNPEAFLMDMGPRPTARHSLDRIDVNGNYEPGNCRWATPLVQSNNRRDTRYVTLDGKRISLRDACRVTGLAVMTVCNRIKKGWPESRWFIPPMVQSK